MNINKKLFQNLDLEGIVKKSIKTHFNNVEKDLPSDSKLDESYVAEPKQFKQVSEFVSQKTKEAHINLYKEYIETLNKVSAELDTADRTDVNSKHSDYRSLKLDETYNLNATWLHELYFANCFDPHSEIVMDSSAFIELQKYWGTFDDFQRDFMACALSSRNGWAVCGYNLYLKQLVNIFIDGHNQNIPVGFYPIIVVDMWEHASRDYLNDKKSYLISQMRELNWTAIEERVNKVKSIAQILK